MIANLNPIWSYILPELVVVLAILVLVFFDLFRFSNTKVTGVFTLGIFTLVLMYIVNGPTDTVSLFRVDNYFLYLADDFGRIFKILIYISTIVILFFSLSSKELLKESYKNTEYFILISGMLLGMSVMVSSLNLIVIYLGFEMLSLSSYLLAGYLRHSERSAESAFKYLIYGAASSGIMLFGISLFYGLTGSTNLTAINALLSVGELNVTMTLIAAVMILAGVGFKVSAAPFHFWTPDVYEGAPIMVTAYLSVASKAAGFLLLYRFLTAGFMKEIENGFWIMYEVVDWHTMLFGISILTMTLGNLAALWQKNLKRLLAYSSIAHAGYLLLGIAVLSNDGFAAVIFYFFVYLFMNLGAFAILMLIANRTGNENMNSLDGLGYTSPFLASLFVIFLVSLAGLPPTGGFVGKLYIFVALFGSELYTFALIALLNTVVSLYYYARIIKHLFLREGSDNTPVINTSFSVKLMLIVLTVPIFVLGLYFSPFLNYITSLVN